MNHPDYNSPSELKDFLEQRGMAMQKRFGQNFMVNPSARAKIAGCLDIQAGERLWEIGPGLGCMTEEFLSRGASVTAFEIDRGFVCALRCFFAQQEKEGRLSIAEGDVLKLWKAELCLHERPSKIAGNLPYNIASTFIADTITANALFDKCVFTVQKEVAQRMAAQPGSASYSAFSVICQYGYTVKAGISLGPGSFWPRPSVASQAVIMEKKERPASGRASERFARTVHVLFSARRKTVLNNIKPLLPDGIQAEDVFERCGIEKNERAENISVETFVQLDNVLSEMAKTDRLHKADKEYDGTADCR